MKNTFALGFIALSTVLLSGCGTMMMGPQQAIKIKSNPGGAQVTIYDNFDTPVFQKATPCEVVLNRKANESSGAHYRVVITKEGYQPVEIQLTGKVSRAYLANTLNVVGFVVDPMTGGMWTLSPDVIDVTLVGTPATAFNRKDGIFICLKQEVPREWLPYLKPVKS